MKIQLEKKDVIPLMFLLIFIGMNVGGFFLFPYETIIFETHDNELNYTIMQFITLLSTIPIVLFFFSMGYILGAARREKPIQEIPERG